jgi:dipeptidyl aminopeptidase/acylaminoacyl peptidase
VSTTQADPRPVFEQFVAVRRLLPAIAFSPDGADVAYVTDTSGQFNLWRQSSAGGYPHQLTTFVDETIRQIDWSPDGATILFTADHNGDEFTQLYRIPARGGWPEKLTDAPHARHFLAALSAWSPDGRLIAYSGNDRQPTDQEVIVRDLDAGEVGRPMPGNAYYDPVAWSPDGKLLTVVKATSNSDADVYVVSVADGTVRHLTPHDDPATFYAGPWAADGSVFYLISNTGREFMGLAFFSLSADSYEWVETPDWDVEDVAVSVDGRYLAWLVNEEGYSRVYVRDLTTGRVTRPDFPDGVIYAMVLAPTSGKLAAIVTRPRHPAEIFVADLDSGSVNQITHGFLGGLQENDLTEPELVHFPTFDGRKIPALLYRPDGPGPFAVVLSIHGGPEWQERPRYGDGGLYQYLTSRGIGVLAPNIRGSTGYGKTYQRLIYHDWGGDELKDLEAAAVYLRSLDWADARRIGVYGGSFGGFATLSCVSRLPDYWAAGVDVVGPSNLVTFAQSVPPPWRRFFAELVGDPNTEADFLRSRSPMTYVDQIKAPLFVIQGANDPRVAKAESDQIVERLRARGVDVRYDVYDDEGHGFTKHRNEMKSLRDTAAFFEEHLL